MEWKALASRCCQLPSGSTGTFVADNMCQCGSGEKKTRHYLFVQCEAQAPQIKALLRGVGNPAGGGPGPTVRTLFREEKARAVPAAGN